MITIKSRPYDLLAPKINPVYNGLPFVVDSDRKNRSNFRYICKAYVDGQLVTELRHNPDISSSNYGIFDIGRVVENYMSFDNTTLNNYASNDASRTAKPYYVELGEEYGRIVEITSIYAYGGGGSYVKTKYPHNLRAGDRFLIQGSTISAYNGYKSVVSVAGSNLLRISTTFVGTPDLSLTYLVEGERINGFTSQTINNVQYLRIAVNMNNSSTSNWSRFNIGDIVMINQDSVAYQFYENTEWSIIAKSPGVWLSQPVMFYTLNAPYKGSISSTVFGSIISRDNYNFQNLVSTKLDNSITFNGVLQYNEYLDWNPSKYVFSSTTNGQFLSNKPSLTTNLCSTDHYTLTSFSSAVNGVNSKITTETWSTPAIGLRPGSATQSSNVLSSGSTSLRFTMNGNETIYYSVGDYITITNTSGGNPVSGRIVRVVYSAPNTIVYTDITSTIPFINGYIEQTVKVRYRVINQSNTSVANQIPCGPANYNYTEFTDGTCYKYFVYGSIPKSTIYYDAMNRYLKTSETWTFNIECPCDRYKSYHIAWLNECGGLDYYKFNMRSDKSLTIEKSIYEKKLPSVQSNMGYKYKTGDRGRQVYNTKSVETIVARTNFLNQSELDWIKYIYESPEVYWVDDVNNKLYPVIITETSVEEPNKLNRGDAGSLYIYTITMEMANDRVIQRGGNIKSITGGINNVLVPFTYTYNRY